MELGPADGLFPEGGVARRPIFGPLRFPCSIRVSPVANTAPEPIERFGALPKYFRPVVSGERPKGRVRWAAHESSGLTMKRAERIVPLKAAALLRCGAARALAHGHRSASPACSGVRCRRASPERLRGCGPAWSARRSRASG